MGRALALLSCLTGRRHWPGGELAQRLGVTARTVRRDIERLRRLGYDITATSGVDGGYRLQPGTTPPPLFLDHDESIAVVAALLTAAGSDSTGMPDASSRALVKLHHVLPAAARGTAEALRDAASAPHVKSAPAVDPDHLAGLAESCRDVAAVRFGYVDRSGRSSARRVEPAALVTVARAWYLIGFDLDRDDWRVFRLDRIDGAVERTGHGARRREIPGGDAMAYLGASLATMPYEHNVVVELPCSADDVLAARPTLSTQRVERIGRATCRVRLGAADLGDLTRQLLDLFAVATPSALSTNERVAEHLAVASSTLAELATTATGSMPASSDRASPHSTEDANGP